jgi:Family of unknown function (DUF6516)
MTTTVSAYFDDVERAFLLSPVVRSLQVREREERLQEGFLRLRAVLSNGDVLEAFEFVMATPDALQTLTYRIHWQQGDGQLKRRRDNAPHHKEVPTFPHHVHVGLAGHIEPSEPMTILKVLALVERKLQSEGPLC